MNADSRVVSDIGRSSAHNMTINGWQEVQRMPTAARTRNHTQSTILSVARFLMATILTSRTAECFVISHASPYARDYTRIMKHPATKPQEVDTTSAWSLAASNTKGESRFGLRRRVKAVLQNAKNRTGVPNLNSDGYDLGLDDKPIRPEAFDESEYVYFDDTSRIVSEKNANLNKGYARSTASVGGSPVLNGSSAVSTASTAASLTRSTEAVNKADRLPFTLPTLSEEQKKQLRQGERVQYQAKMGRDGHGFVVVDVRAPPYVVWECLLDFENYPQQIETVRSMRMFTSTHLNSSYIAEDPVLPAATRSTRHYGRASVTRASFVLSKFRLNIAAVHKYRPHPDGHYMTFTLDKACKNVVLQDAKGIWYTQAGPEGRQDYTRVWLLCELQVSPLLPTFIVDYAARRAMPRATTWLKPVVETAANRWLGTGM